MSTGFVYVMINPAMPGLIKIGLSRRSSEERANDFRGTALPDDFIVVYDELVSDCELVEERIKTRFKEYRYKPNREFFTIPIREALRGLMDESQGFVVPRINGNDGVEILPDLLRKYPYYLKPDFYSIKITHTRDGVVYLESVRRSNSQLRDELVERLDLGFITDSGGEMFCISRSPNDNARIFVHQLDDYSMSQCTDLFTHEACISISKQHNIS